MENVLLELSEIVSQNEEINRKLKHQIKLLLNYALEEIQGNRFVNGHLFKLSQTVNHYNSTILHNENNTNETAIEMNRDVGFVNHKIDMDSICEQDLPVYETSSKTVTYLDEPFDTSNLYVKYGITNSIFLPHHSSGLNRTNEVKLPKQFDTYVNSNKKYTNIVAKLFRNSSKNERKKGYECVECLACFHYLENYCLHRNGYHGITGKSGQCKDCLELYYS